MRRANIIETADAAFPFDFQRAPRADICLRRPRTGQMDGGEGDSDTRLSAIGSRVRKIVEHPSGVEVGVDFGIRSFLVNYRSDVDSAFLKACANGRP